VRISDQRIEPVLLTVDDLVQLTSISRAKWYDLIAKGELRTVQIGRSRRVTVEELQRFIADHEVGAE